MNAALYESYISPAHRLPTAAVAHSPLPALLHLPIHPRHQRYTTICYIIVDAMPAVAVNMPAAPMTNILLLTIMFLLHTNC